MPLKRNTKHVVSLALQPIRAPPQTRDRTNAQIPLMHRHLDAQPTMPPIRIQVIHHHEPGIVIFHQLRFQLRIVNRRDIHEVGIRQFRIGFEVFQERVSVILADNDSRPIPRLLVC